MIFTPSLVLFLIALVEPQPADGESLTQLNAMDNEFLKEYCGLRSSSDSEPQPAGNGDLNLQDYLWTVYLTAQVENTVSTTRGRNWDMQEEPVPVACSGVLISQRHVLTAAHCLFNRLEFEYHSGYDVTSEYRYSTPTEDPLIRVYYGLYGLGETTGRFYYYSEAKNRADLVAYDYAILELTSPIKNEDIIRGVVRPICFTDNFKPRTEYHRLTGMAGYGGGSKPFYDREEEKDMSVDFTVETPCLPSPTGVFPPTYPENVKCYKPLIWKKGDDGAAYFVYDDKERAYLSAISTGKDPGNRNFGFSIDALYENKDDLRTPLHVVREQINLDY